MAVAASAASPLSGLQLWTGNCGFVAQLFGYCWDAPFTAHLTRTCVGLHACEQAWNVLGGMPLCKRAH
jgi:hypothetical protein